MKNMVSGNVSELLLISAESEPRAPDPQGSVRAYIFVCAHGRYSNHGPFTFQSFPILVTPTDISNPNTHNNYLY